MKVCLSVTVLLAFVAFAASQGCVQEDNCVAADGCRCASRSSPIPVADTPQFVTISFNDAVSAAYYSSYYQPLLAGRVNPDGNPVTATFYVPHEYTDYSRVNALYVSGQEIAVHSITKNPVSDYWRTADEDTLTDEFAGQKTIISRFANIPESDIRGARVPNFELAGDVLFRAYSRAGVEYDATITSFNADRYFPFTLTIPNQISCPIGECPVDGHSIWAAPIIDLIGDGVECNNLQACRVAGTAEEIAAWLTAQFNLLYQGERAPMNLVASAAWFVTTEGAFEGLTLFLDSLAALNDVYIVSNSQVIDWISNPVPVDEVDTSVEPRTANCGSPLSCALAKGEETRYMTSCVACPAVFPWLGNPAGEDLDG
ncbi:hypothetical protein Trydic_g15849 [Trypoxylus dichotomus]